MSRLRRRSGAKLFYYVIKFLVSFSHVHTFAAVMERTDQKTYVSHVCQDQSTFCQENSVFPQSIYKNKHFLRRKSSFRRAIRFFTGVNFVKAD